MRLSLNALSTADVMHSLKRSPCEYTDCSLRGPDLVDHVITLFLCMHLSIMSHPTYHILGIGWGLDIFKSRLPRTLGQATIQILAEYNDIVII